ncbi:tail fiber domain-containing protein [Sphingorhabdus sp. 109]|uniref:tail fiber domain-containing protein n=1 Tax=Sphingorhabdus sp. 109 TaxID=2653173 RepID=UPI0012EF1CA7|nr:tail fiber domain-containing protein [Sphingorhabdus sp. 109]VWX56729.1 hypothetical protein SPHINGOR109_10583 [Sphingorhabdus sp. 109]
MADEQDWAAFADQDHLKEDDTLLARTSGGGGVEIPGEHIVARRGDDEPFHAPGLLQGGFGAETISGGVDDWDDASNAISGSGKRLMRTGDTNHPPKDGYYHPFTFEYDTKDGSNAKMTQIAIPYLTNSTIFYRIKNSTWSGWEEVLSSMQNGDFRPSTDGVGNLGFTNARFDTVYATTGSISTSDEREKTWRGAMTDDEYAAALQIIDELGFYQWNDSIAAKGQDAARFHFGPRAQRVFAILDEHLGEDAWHHYAFACYDSWEAEYAEVLDDKGDIVPGEQGGLIREAGDRYGIRTEQLTMFLLAAQARRQSALEARIELLE